MKTWLHFKKICTHKYWVFKYCARFGIPIRGLKHDLSKFSPIEFWEGVKYYQGDSSPIDACKKKNGWSAAWQHHKGRNTHHYEFWQDDFDHGGKPLVMPYKDSIEMLCDYLGAGRAYMGEDFSYKAENQWWKNKCKGDLAMHPVNKHFITSTMRYLAECEQNGCDFNITKIKMMYYNSKKMYG